MTYQKDPNVDNLTDAFSELKICRVSQSGQTQINKANPTEINQKTCREVGIKDNSTQPTVNPPSN
ncbi:9490_t:CDS:2 [Cetraspora pellucida]|uniref:9490_t:CDS:1 n=1 Tax=Cetraspora pellucida TaxID=1433469 RepID=A0ACA9K8X0_9GLOM|nr:9490_t:CDS:2 [Cetraspora pellucida]